MPLWKGKAGDNGKAHTRVWHLTAITNFPKGWQCGSKLFGKIDDLYLRANSTKKTCLPYIDDDDDKAHKIDESRLFLFPIDLPLSFSLLAAARAPCHFCRSNSSTFDMEDSAELSVRTLERHCLVDGTCHCDWRITLQGCVEQNAMTGVYIGNIAISAVVFIIGMHTLSTKNNEHDSNFCSLDRCLSPDPSHLYQGTSTFWC